MTVLTDDLLASFAESVGPVDEARLLPPVLYTSPKFYEFNSHLAPRGRYSWQEETLVQFNRWLVRRYREHWPANGA